VGISPKLRIAQSRPARRSRAGGIGRGFRPNSLVKKELDRVSQSLTGRMRQLAERYATPLPQLVDEVEELSAKVAEHLKKMGMSYDG